MVTQNVTVFFQAKVVRWVSSSLL